MSPSYMIGLVLIGGDVKGFCPHEADSPGRKKDPKYHR